MVANLSAVPRCKENVKNLGHRRRFAVAYGPMIRITATLLAVLALGAVPAAAAKPHGPRKPAAAKAPASKIFLYVGGFVGPETEAAHIGWTAVRDVRFQSSAGPDDPGTSATLMGPAAGGVLDRLQNCALTTCRIGPMAIDFLRSSGSTSVRTLLYDVRVTAAGRDKTGEAKVSLAFTRRDDRPYAEPDITKPTPVFPAPEDR
jgi:hypothetical protein